ncbi:hypothetical protein FEE95_10575 [Maribacter algarum]|uniref:Lipoprotein n=1 Tax=Maribacter algarum (ex Zhang et al. 2020) TaxID=2578118 RepID=A0A5S3PQF4_9FLAO|nr:hypothetical protein [Maribacter algarum]TMM56932.1 hypothetical protein FEE95_10575 [Maribacter algarum]
MKKMILLVPILVLLIACGGVKKTQKALNAGDYSNAINNALQNLAENKTKKSHQPYIVLLEDAFKKNTERELKYIAFLEKDGNEASYEDIYKSYVSLRDIQERIRPLLPLRITEENRDAEFSFSNYENDIIDYKEDLSEYLFDNAEDLLTNAVTKRDYRKAYNDFVYLEEINPGFEDTRQKIEEAHEKGIDYVEVQVLNNSNQIIPVRLSEELLNFNTFGLDDLWTKYHSNPVSNIKYDYGMQVSFNQIDISPEQLSEKEIIREKQIKDGYKYATDSNGNVVKDSLGNKIKIDKFKTVRCRFNQFTQFKSARVAGNVIYLDFKTKQQLNSYPLASEFIFEHIYANIDGDKRALDNDLRPYLDQVAIPFPTNEQMVYDAGEDLKARIKSIVGRHRFN